MATCTRITTDRKSAVRRLLGQSGYSALRLLKAIVTYKLGMPYELPNWLLAEIVKRGDVAFDIGANLGQYACRLSRLVGSTGRVYCFEPVAENVKLLQRMVRLLRLKNVEIAPYAVSDRDGEAEIFIPILARNVEIVTQATLDLQITTAANVHIRSERVQTIRVDRIAEEQQIERLDVLKCDTEGHDAQVVRGAMECIVRHKPVLVLEAAPAALGLAEILEMGYRAYYYTDRRLRAWRHEEVIGQPHCYIYVHESGDRLKARITSSS